MCLLYALDTAPYVLTDSYTPTASYIPTASYVPPDHASSIPQARDR